MSGNWDIYWQRVGGKNPVNLTKDSVADDTQPSYSPDGNYIAFRSEREPKGISVMEATSENVRRVSDMGHDPLWSPDAKSSSSVLPRLNRFLVMSFQADYGSSTSQLGLSVY